MFNITAHEFISRAITLIIAFTVHEFAHAYIADSLGDPTPRQAGRLTLNPLVHLDLFGSLLLLFAGFGWAKPTPVNPVLLRQRSRYGLLWVSVAGPLSNLLLAVAAGLVIRSGLINMVWSTGILPTLGEFLYIFFYLNAVLAIFNLFPIPPLDGEKIITALLPEKVEEAYAKIRPFGSFIMLALILIGPRIGFDIIGWIITPAVAGLQYLIIGV